jgi:hypothetical protein
MVNTQPPINIGGNLEYMMKNKNIIYCFERRWERTMTKILISNIIEIQDYSKDMLNFCKSRLTFKNSEYEKKKRMGYYCYGMDKEIKLYNVCDNKLYVPYGFFSELYKFYPINSDYVDYTTTKKVDIKSNINLREYQEPVPKIVEEQCNGLILAGCGLSEKQ